MKKVLTIFASLAAFALPTTSIAQSRYYQPPQQYNQQYDRYHYNYRPDSRYQRHQYRQYQYDRNRSSRVDTWSLVAGIIIGAVITDQFGNQRQYYYDQRSQRHFYYDYRARNYYWEQNTPYRRY